MREAAFKPGRSDVMRRRALGGIIISTLLLAGVIPALAAEEVETIKGSAYGVSASVKVLGVSGSVGPTPTASVPSGGGSDSGSAASVSIKNLLNSGTLRVSASGSEVGTGLGQVRSVSEVENLAVQLAGIGSILDSSLIRAQCQADAKGVSGSTNLVGVSVLGHGVLANAPAPNTTLTVAGVGTLRLNSQRTDSAGNLTVTALSLDIKAAGLASGSIKVGQVVCGTTVRTAPTTPTTQPESTTTTTPDATTTTAPSSSTTTSPASPTTTTAVGPTTTNPSNPTTTSDVGGTGDVATTTTSLDGNNGDPGDSETESEDPQVESEKLFLVCETVDPTSLGSNTTNTGLDTAEVGVLSSEAHDDPGDNTAQIGLLLLAGAAVGGLAGYSARPKADDWSAQ